MIMQARPPPPASISTPTGFSPPFSNRGRHRAGGAITPADFFEIRARGVAGRGTVIIRRRRAPRCNGCCTVGGEAIFCYFNYGIIISTGRPALVRAGQGGGVSFSITE